jgi:hypothetical protein
MPPVEFELTISAGGRPQTNALDRAATKICFLEILFPEITVASDYFAILLPAGLLLLVYCRKPIAKLGG